jgi:hypothetical protein
MSWRSDDPAALLSMTSHLCKRSLFQGDAIAQDRASQLNDVQDEAEPPVISVSLRWHRAQMW